MAGKKKSPKRTEKEKVTNKGGRPRGAASVVWLRPKQIEDVCGSNGLIVVPKSWLKKMGFDPDSKAYPNKMAVESEEPEPDEEW